MAYCCTVYQSIAVKNQSRASCTCLRRRRIRRQQLNRLFSAGCSTRDRKVKNSILWCTAVGNSCFRSRLPRCYRSNTDGCCGTCPASGTCHTRGAGWASRPSNAGCSGRTAGACRAGDAGCSGCTAGTRRTAGACRTRWPSNAGHSGRTAGACRTRDTGCSGRTAGTRGTRRATCRAGCSSWTCRSSCSSRTSWPGHTGSASRAGNTSRTSSTRHAARAHGAPLAAKAPRPHRTCRASRASWATLAAAVLSAVSIHPIVRRAIHIIPSAESRAMIHIVLPFRKIAWASAPAFHSMCLPSCLSPYFPVAQSNGGCRPLPGNPVDT